MICSKTKKEAAQTVFEWKKNGFRIGLVPTMGSLHEGHLALLRSSKAQGFKTVLTIFVNPTQFNDRADFNNYPRDVAADLALVGDLADLVFVPADAEMYNSLPVLNVEFGELETVMEGKFRPGHFNGVGIVVSKLFNIIQPDVAFFGQKDLQQCAVVEQLVEDLSFPIEIVKHPIVRESDGLAMSSRNRRLTTSQRSVAGKVFQAIDLVKANLKSGASLSVSRAKGLALLQAEPLFDLDYLEIVDSKTLSPLTEVSQQEIAIRKAVFLGDVRLIDNILFKI